MTIGFAVLFGGLLEMVRNDVHFVGFFPQLTNSTTEAFALSEGFGITLVISVSLLQIKQSKLEFYMLVINRLRL